MTPSQLLARIEALGSVDAKYIDKIRKQIEDPAKVVKSKAIVKYLLGKSQINKTEAKKLLAPPTEDEIVVVETAADFDSSALIDTGDFQTPSAEPIDEAVAEPIVEVEAVAEPIVEVEAIAEPIVEAVVEPIDMDATTFEPSSFEPDVPSQGGGFYNETALDEQVYDEPAFDEPPATPAKEYSAVEAFKGKRDQKDQFKTKWLYIGAGILGLLGIGIYVLQFVVFGQNAEAMAKAVSDAHERGNWAETTKRCDEMIKAYPGHKDIPVVRAKRVQSILRSKFQAKS